MKMSILITLLMTIIGNVFACDCDGTTNFDTSFKYSDRVFVGKVISMNPYKVNRQGQFTKYLIEMQVNMMYKGGAVTKRLKLTTAAGIAACGYPFKIGTIYLVYTSVNNGVDNVHYCGRTQLFAQAKEDIDKLNLLVSNKK